MKRRVVSLLLAFCMIMLLTPTAFAEGPETACFIPGEGLAAYVRGKVAMVDTDGRLWLFSLEYDEVNYTYSYSGNASVLMTDVKMISVDGCTLMVLGKNGTLWCYRFSADRHELLGSIRIMDGIKKIVQYGKFAVLSDTDDLSVIEVEYHSWNDGPTLTDFSIIPIDHGVTDICNGGYFLKENEVRSELFGKSVLKKTLDFSDGVRIWKKSSGFMYDTLFVCTESGDLWSWGANGNGQLGNGGVYEDVDRLIAVGSFEDGVMEIPIYTTKPTKILSNVESLWMTNEGIRAREWDGTAWQWGDGEPVTAYVTVHGDYYRYDEPQYPENFPFGYVPREIQADYWMCPDIDSEIRYNRDGSVWVKINRFDDFDCIVEGKEITGVPGQFSDIPPGHYCEEAVSWAVEQDITKGTSETTFSPNESCTRAQAVTFLWRAAGSPQAISEEQRFVDVSDGAYYEEAVRWAVEQEITAGTSSDTFSPDEPCTRAQIVTFLWRFKGGPGASCENFFDDVHVKDYYFVPVCWAVENEVTAGVGDGRFAPDEFCTRAQIVTFLYRAQN